jgi:hypothetical protein
VARAIAGSDGQSVRLVIPGLRPGNVVYLRMDPKSQQGEQMWATEAWYTLNAIPRDNAPASVGPAIKLLERGDLANFAEPRGTWAFVGDAKLAAARPDRLEGAIGKGAMLNGPNGTTSDIFTLFDHADVEVHLEFMVPKGSNSGVYFMSRYEVQILDSFGVASPQHSDCGGIYQRWDDARGEGKEGYEGVPPKENASLPPGEWQTFDVIFRAPRFDDSGKKIANARFERVVHNGKIIHQNVEVTGPTRAGMTGEKPFAPLRLQGDHGPVAFRNIVVRPLP